MRFFHLSDLHLGKTLNGFSLIEQQRECLYQIINYLKIYTIDAVFICGDIYDKTNPSNDAITLFNDFLNDLHKTCTNVKICIIAGNHDSFAKLNYASSFMRANNIYISSYPLGINDVLDNLVIEDDYGLVKIHFACFCKPLYLAMENKPEKMDYTQMMNEILSRSEYEPNMRHILLAHQFMVQGTNHPVLSDSEVLPLINGGLDSVDLSQCNYPFNYIACGHLHRYQRVGKTNAFYSGSIYPYSISEAFDTKGIIYGVMDEKGNVNLDLLPLHAQKKVKVVKDSIENIVTIYGKNPSDDYVSVVLTKQSSDPLLHQKLVNCFPNLLEVSMQSFEKNVRNQQESELQDIAHDPLIHLQQLGEIITNQTFSQQQLDYCRSLMDGINDEAN